MSILHVVNKSPYERNSLNTCVGYCQPGDVILLIEDGVYGAMRGGQAAARLQGLEVAALGPDLAARGIGTDRLIDGIKVVDYNGFVDLTVAKDKVQSWL